MAVEFGWFLPTYGDSEFVGTPALERPGTLDYLVQVARAAEQAGFTFALVPVGPGCQDAWMASALIAGQTERLRFLVAMRPGFIAPTVAARMAVTFDQLSQGRVSINIVTGGHPTELAADGDFTEHDERYERTAEFMEVVREAWTKHAFDYDGEHYRVVGGGIKQTPFQKPYPPFYFGGASDAAQRVGARLADIYLLWGETLPQVQERIAVMRARAAEHGRTLRFGLRIHVFARETEAEAWAAAERVISRMDRKVVERIQAAVRNTDSVGQQRMLAYQDGDSSVIAPNFWAGIGAARSGVGTALVGSGKQVAARLREYAEAGVSTFILSSQPHLEEASNFGRYVMPLVQDLVEAPVPAIAG